MEAFPHVAESASAPHFFLDPQIDRILQPSLLLGEPTCLSSGQWNRGRVTGPPPGLAHRNLPSTVLCALSPSSDWTEGPKGLEEGGDKRWGGAQFPLWVGETSLRPTSQHQYTLHWGVGGKWCWTDILQSFVIECSLPWYLRSGDDLNSLEDLALLKVSKSTRLIGSPRCKRKGASSRRQREAGWWTRAEISGPGAGRGGQGKADQLFFC